MRRTVLAIAVILLATPALANHGKVGLWNVTSTVEVTLPASPAAGRKAVPPPVMPAMPPVTVQMCMSKEEVASNAPPHLDRGAAGCNTRVASQNADTLRASMICKGKLKGSGSIEVHYNGAEHYSGSYSFKGVSGGRAMNMKTSFKGDWIKADCGTVKPFAPTAVNRAPATRPQ